MKKIRKKLFRKLQRFLKVEFFPVFLVPFFFFFFPATLITKRFLFLINRLLLSFPSYLLFLIFPNEDFPFLPNLLPALPA